MALQQHEHAAPIAWAIAGSDSGGGAGIQADLATFRDFGVHGCTVVTALTAQNSVAMVESLATPAAHVGAQIETLAADLTPAAIKLGMLAQPDIIDTVAGYLANYAGPVVLDPVLRSSTGAVLMTSAEMTSTDNAMEAMRALLPHVAVVTPNIAEAQALTGRVIDDQQSLCAAAHRLVALGARSALVTGGHFRREPLDRGPCVDYWTDGEREFYLAGEYLDTPHTHGTGCTLSSAITALLARGFDLVDALVVAKAYVTAAIRDARGVGAGPGPVSHGGWPTRLADWPGASDAWPSTPQAPVFPACRPLGLYPVVDDVAWLERLLPLGIDTIQLRIKQPSVPSARDRDALRGQVARAVELARQHGAQLFINDHWALAIECGAFGVHLGQDDLDSANVAAIAGAGLRLGVSTHSDFEIARAHQLRPSYIAIGPIYATTTKKMTFSPRGLVRLQRWVNLLGTRYPLTAIGGIDLERAPGVLATGVGSCAVVRAITEAPDPAAAVAELLMLHCRPDA